MSFDRRNTDRAYLDNEIHGLFTDKAFLSALVKSIETQREQRSGTYQLQDGQIDILNQIIIDREIFESAPINKLLSEQIDARFGKAMPVTARDATTALFQQSAGHPLTVEFGEEIHPEWLQGYIRAIQFLVAALYEDSDKRFGEADIDLGVFAADLGFEDGSEGDIWEHRGNTVFSTCTKEKSDDSPPWFVSWPCHKVHARIGAWGTVNAIQTIERHLEEWISTIADIVRVSAMDCERHAAAQKPWIHSNSLEEFLGPQAAWASYDCSTLIGHLHSTDSKAISDSCLTLLLQSDTRERTELERRLLNSITLFREADRQALPAVGLTLCFSAIEALLTKKGNVVEQVASYVPALLCAIDNDGETVIAGKERRIDAAKAIKALYDVRSLLAHGGEVHASVELFMLTKRMAAGVIRGVCCWMDYCNRTGDSQHVRKSLISELYVCDDNDQSLVGVRDLSDLLPENSVVKRLVRG